MTRPAPLSLDQVPGAPPAGSRLCTLDDLPSGTSRVVEFRDGAARLEMFLHRDGDIVVAYVNRCPHAGTPLDWQPGRFLDATGSVFLCATHGAQFRIGDGFCVSGPCAGKSLQSVKISVRDGAIYSA